MLSLRNDLKHMAGLALRDAPHRLVRRARTAVALAIVLALVALSGALPVAASGISTAQTPTGTLTIVNNGPGDQSDPHISGALAAYTSSVSGNSEIRYHNLLTGADASLPTNGGLDFLPDVSGTTIVYTHLSASGSAIDAFDTSTAGPPVELDPQPASNRRGSAIGNKTVAWVDFGFYANTAYPEIVAYDLSTQTATRLTNDRAFDTSPAVSPDGSVIVWTKCESPGVGCDIWQAARGSGAWVTTQLTGATGEELNSDTNGQVVVYDTVRAGEADIYWQPVGGGVEQHLALPGTQHNPSISGNLVAFENFDETALNWDIQLYDLATGTLYPLTNSPVDETLNDLSVAPDGQVRVVWTAQDGSDANVYAFGPPSTPPPIIIPYLASGYAYLVVPSDAGAGFEQPTFDDSAFAVGAAGFGTVPGQCPLNTPSYVKTTWPVNTDILLRKTFTLPAGARNLQVNVAIDNDVQVFLNGHDISGGLRPHDGCAYRGMVTFPVPDGLLNTGANLLAVRGRDRGGISYLDLQILGDLATDTTSPSITISAPASTIYLLNQTVAASYGCADESGGSGLATCVGPVMNGSPIDTGSVGTKTFTVNATDNAGNAASRSVSYTVAYNICVLYDQSKSHKLGSVVPIKLQLCDASGANKSAASIIVHAAGLRKVDNSASSTLDDPSNANPDNDFRYDATLGGNGGYIYNLSTKNLTTGTWALSFTASGDPATHAVQFDVR